MPLVWLLAAISENKIARRSQVALIARNKFSKKEIRRQYMQTISSIAGCFRNLIRTVCYSNLKKPRFSEILFVDFFIPSNTFSSASELYLAAKGKEMNHMKNTYTLFVAAASVVIGFSTFARATSVSFDFTNASPSVSATGFTFTNGNPSLGLILNVTGFTTGIGFNGVGQSIDGLGVASANSALETDGTPVGSGGKYKLNHRDAGTSVPTAYTEGLLFTFAPSAVTFTSLTFHFITSVDDASVKIVSGNVSLYNGAIDSSNTSLHNKTITLASSLTATQFSLSTVNAGDEYTLAGITVNYTPNVGNPSPVSLPASVLGGSVLMSGLMGYRMLRSRKA